MSFAGQLRPIVAALAVLGATAMAARAEDLNDYPTAARIAPDCSSTSPNLVYCGANGSGGLGVTARHRPRWTDQQSPLVRPAGFFIARRTVFDPKKM